MLENRITLTVTLGSIIGIIMGLYCKISIVFLYLFIIFLYLLLKKPHKRKFKLISVRRYFRYVKIFFTKKVFILILISSLISNTITNYKNIQIDNFQKKYNAQEMQLKAKVISNAKMKKYNKIYIIESSNKKFYLNVKKNDNIDYGDIILIKGTFNKPKTKSNYKGFDYKEHLKIRGIIGTINAKNMELIEKNQDLFNKIFLKIKYLIQNSFDQNVSSILLGILLGYTDNISEDVKENFNETNISHILAVSGMHVGYLILFCMFVFDRLVGKRMSKIFSILILIFYIKLVGYSPSVVRAVIMGIMLLVSKLLYRKSDVWSSLSLSLLFLLIYNPFFLKNVSLLFSYVATLGIIIYLRFFRKSKKITDTIGITFSVTIFILPITAIYFNKIPVLSLITGLIAGVLVAPIFIVLLFFIILGSMFSLVLIKKILSVLVKMLLIITNIGGKLPFSKIYVVLPNYLEVIIYYVIVFLSIFLFYIYKLNRKQNKMFNKRIKNLISLLKFRYLQNKNRVISIFLIVSLILLTINFFPRDLKIHFIDVGQGDSCLIITPHNKKILIDGGGSENYDVGKNTLVPYLLARRIKTIDYVIVSHFDTDHVRTDF